MDVLTVSDEVRREVYGPGLKLRCRSVQLVLSCGDLPPSYLDFILSTLNVPCLYVPGNHDGRPEQTTAGELLIAPSGWINLHGRLRQIGGLSVCGFGGAP
jgi:predicted phosphodiesterase